MTPEERERMNALCAQIQQEKDFDKFEELTGELTRLISMKERRFPEHKFLVPTLTNKGWRLIRAVATKVLKPVHTLGADKVEISIPDADDLYREIRLANSLTDRRGNMLALQPGTHVDVILGADRENLVTKSTSSC